MSFLKHASVAVIRLPTFVPIPCVLAVWNKKFNGWALPGGKVEPGETFETALDREVDEETGLVVEEKRLVYEDVSALDPERLVHAYEVLKYSGTPQPKEGMPVWWVTEQELLTLSPFAAFYKNLFFLLNNSSSTL